MINEGSLVYLYDLKDKNKYLLALDSSKVFHTHKGSFKHSDIIMLDYGNVCCDSHQNSFLILRPSLADILMSLKRCTQIIYPKDIGYIMLKLGLRNGDRIIESGTGSGVTTVALAYCVHPEGKVYSYDRNTEFSANAQKNLITAGMEHYVKLKSREIIEGAFFDEKFVDSVFLDLKDPTIAIGCAYEALKPNGMLGILLPTVNQVIDAIHVLDKYAFIEVEVAEILLRHYKINAYRLRPHDSMTRHTGYLIFARRSVMI